MNNNDEKIFYSYNEITKYYDVRIIMVGKNKYEFKLSKKLGSNKGTSKIDKLIEAFDEFKDQMLKFKDQQLEFNAKVVEFMNNQSKFNEMVLKQFKDHGWIK